VNARDDMIAGWKKDSTFREEYDALEEQFALFDTLLKACYEAGRPEPGTPSTKKQRTPPNQGIVASSKARNEGSGETP